MAASASLSGANFRVRRDQFAPDQIFRRGIDRFHRRDRAVAQMEDGEFAVGRIAPHHQRIAGPRQPRDLEFQVILVRPEPGHFAVVFGPCPSSPAPHAWPGRWRSARIRAGSRRLRGHTWRVQSPAAKMAGSPVLARADPPRCRHGRPDPLRAASSSLGTTPMPTSSQVGVDRVCRRRAPASTLPFAFEALRRRVSQFQGHARLVRARRRRNPTPAWTRRAPSAGPAASNTVTCSPRLAPTAATSRPI